MSSRHDGPPRLALRLLHVALPAEAREELVGDLLEEFVARSAQRGIAAARRRFWLETLAAVVKLGFRARRNREAVIKGDSLMTNLIANLRYGARVLRRAPTFTAICVLTLGLGIGATTAIYSLVSPILFRSLPYPSPNRLMMVWERDDQGRQTNTSYLTYRDFARESKSIASSAAMGSWMITLSQNGDGERVEGQRVSWSFFRTLGVRPALGRDFFEEEDAPDRNRVVILGHGLWERRFGSDSSLVGRTITLNGMPYTVAGVLPATFESVLSPRSQIWRVLGYSPALPYACRTCRHLRMVARLREGVSREAAQSDLDRISTRLVATYPKEYSAAGTRLISVQESVGGSVRPVLLAILGAVVLVLLISAANVTHLQIARAIRREQEFAIRTALGAGRSRLAGQLLAEGMLLAVAGGVAGVVIGALTLPLLIARLPDTLPRLAAVHLDWPTLGIIALITLTLGAVVGLVPAWRGDGSRLATSLRGGSRLTGSGRHVLRSGLVMGEVALALMLLIGAGLLSRSLLRLLDVNAGFDPSHVLTMEVQATGPKYRDDAALYQHRDRLLAAVRAVPGVASAATTTMLPLGGDFNRYGVHAMDKPLDNPELAPSADRYVVTPDYLAVMRIPLLQGRVFSDMDNRDITPPVVLVSAGLAERIWPQENAIGKHVQIGGTNSPWRTVVGVVGNVHHVGLDENFSMQVYIPDQQWEGGENAVVLAVRTTGDPTAVAAAVRSAAHSVDPTQPILNVATMERVVSASTAQRRLALVLFAAFAGLAALLAGAGIYGVLATRVAEQTKEIGVRTALGATPNRILGLVIRQGASLVAIGLVAGLAGALALTRFLASLLFGVTPTDPTTIALVVMGLAVVALIACVVPAMRALRVDPIRALREE